MALGLLTAAGAHADLVADFNLWDVNSSATHYTDVNTHSGMGGDDMNFQGDLINSSDTDSLYINSWSIDTDYSSSGITFDTNGSWWKGGRYQYGTGTALDPGASFSGLLFAAHTNQGGISTDPGTYTGNFNIYGGSNSSAGDLLATMSFTLDVVPSYDGFTNTLLNPTQTAGVGDTANYVERYSNAGTQTMYVDTQAVSWYTDMTNVSLNFLWGWPGKVDAGQSVDASIFSLTANPGAAIQTHNGDAYMIGGYYPGDAHQFFTDQQWKLNVVPEPSGLLALLPCLGAIIVPLGARRRRS